MYTVKVETEKKTELCQGCLSTDRYLEPLKENMALFLTLLGEQHEDDSNVKHILLCWECAAEFKRIESFRNKIQHANFLLQEVLNQLNDSPISTLSNLTVNNKNHYDLILDYDDDITGNTDIKNECKDIELGSVKEEDDYTDNTSELPDFEVKPEKVKKKRKKEKINSVATCKKYEKKARITKNELDFDNVEQYVTNVFLNLEEMEDFIEKENRDSKKLPFYCKQCKAGYKKSLDFKRHNNLTHYEPSGPYTCLECNKDFTSIQDLNAHWTIHSEMLKCTMCTTLFRSIGEATKHMRLMHSYIYTCNVCGIWFSQYAQFRKHYKELHLRVICDYCGKSLASKRAIEKHIRNAHTTPECKVCSKKYSTYKALERHYRMLHPEVLYGKKQSELAYCVECDKQYASVSKYKVHLATAACHRPPKKVRVPCPECGKIFSRKIYMNNHYKLIHMKITNHHCELCDKNFANPYGLRKHQAFVHEKMSLPKNKICDICGRGFSVNRILINHRRTHTGERPFKCSHCTAAFGQKTALRTHERTQHKGAVFAAELYALVDNGYGVKPE